MNVNRGPSTKTIVVMAVGAVIALGFAIFAIISTVSGTGSNSTAKINPASPNQTASGGANSAGAEHSKEAVMAIHADPFAPLIVNPQSSAAADTRARMDPNAGTTIPMQSGNALPTAGATAGANGAGIKYPLGPQVQPSSAGAPNMANAGQPGSNGAAIRPMPGLPGAGQAAPSGNQMVPTGASGNQQKTGPQKNPFGQSAAAMPPSRQVIVQGSSIRGPAPKVNGWVETSSEPAPSAARSSGRAAKTNHAVALGNPSLPNPFATLKYTPPTITKGSIAPMEVEPPSAEPPTLVGTMIGQRPSAVFKGSKGVRIVEVGESIAGWKVVSVAHGKAVMKLAGREVSLVLTGKGAAGMIVKSNDPYYGPFSHKVRHYLPQQTSAADADTEWIYQQDSGNPDTVNPFEVASSSKPAEHAPAQGPDSDRSPAGEAAKQPMPTTVPQADGDLPKTEKGQSAPPARTGGSDPPANPGR